MSDLDFRPHSTEYTDAEPDFTSFSQIDPSVQALFSGTQSTDEELGTGDAAVKQQADSMRLAMEKHFSDFRTAAKVAVEIAVADVAGLGKASAHPDATDRLCKLAALAARMAWNAFGGAAELSAVVGIAKEELLGPAEELADEAYDKIKDQIEANGTEVTANEFTVALARQLNDACDELVSRAESKLAAVADAQLAQTWRLISGTRDDMTVRGDKLDAEQKGTVTTEMLESLTGIQVGGDFAVQLANTLRQQALVSFAGALDNASDRNAALAKAESGEVVRETARIAHELHEDRWIEEDREERSRVTE